MANYRYGAIALLLIAGLAHARVTPGFTEVEAIGIIQDASPDPVKALKLAQAFDTEGLSDKYYCYAKYLYYKVAQRFPISAEQEVAVTKAKARLEQMKQDHVRCAVTVSSLHAKSLDSALIVERSVSPYSSYPLPQENVPQNQQLPVAVHTNKILDDANLGEDTQQDTSQGNTAVMAAQRPPESQWVNRESSRPPALPQVTTKSIGQIWKTTTSPVSTASSAAECSKNASLLERYHKEAGVFAELSRLVYFTPFALLQAERALEESRVQKSASMAARVLGKSQDLQEVISELQANIAEKDKYLSQVGVRPLFALMEDLKKYTHATQVEFEGSGFWAEAYELPDGALAVVFRGTDNAGGWSTNIHQLIGQEKDLYSGRQNADAGIGQYGQASRLIELLLSKGYRRDRIIVAGHSLGGGLATYVHLKHNLGRAYTFNAAEIGQAHAMELAGNGHISEAKNRILNFISFNPELGSRDVVSQATLRIAELANWFGVPINLLGMHYGPNYFIPVTVGPLSPSLRRLRFKVVATAAGAGAAGAASHAFVRGKNVLAGTAIGAGTAGGTTYILVNTGLKILWREKSLHYMSNLADGMTSFVNESSARAIPLTCASPSFKVPAEQVKFQSLKARLYNDLVVGGALSPQTIAAAKPFLKF